MREWYASVTATFRPKRTDTLRPCAIECVGKRYVFDFCWVAEDHETYAGQRIWLAREMLCGWVPEEDLENMTPAGDYANAPDPAPLDIADERVYPIRVAPGDWMPTKDIIHSIKEGDKVHRFTAEEVKARTVDGFFYPFAGEEK